MFGCSHPAHRELEFEIHVLVHLMHLEEMMATQSTAVTALSTKLDGLKTILDNQTTALASLSTDIQALKNAQGGASAADLQALSDKVDGIVGEAQTNLAAIAAADPGAQTPPTPPTP